MNRDRLQLWVDLYAECRARGRHGLNALVGFQPCPDGCGLRRERWEEFKFRGRQAARCGCCRRFIGYMPEQRFDGK